jgi:hypothetical protein
VFEKPQALFRSPPADLRLLGHLSNPSRTRIAQSARNTGRRIIRPTYLALVLLIYRQIHLIHAVCRA